MLNEHTKSTNAPLAPYVLFWKFQVLQGRLASVTSKRENKKKCSLLFLSSCITLRATFLSKWTRNVTTHKYYCFYYFPITHTWMHRMQGLSFAPVFPEWDLLFHAFLMTFDLRYQSGAYVQLWGILCFVTHWYLVILW